MDTSIYLCVSTETSKVVQALQKGWTHASMTQPKRHKPKNPPPLCGNPNQNQAHHSRLAHGVSRERSWSGVSEAAGSDSSVSHSEVPNNVRLMASRRSSESTRCAITSPSAVAYTWDSPNARCEWQMDSSTCEVSAVCACRVHGRNCGSGWRARKACSHAYSETHTQDT